MRFEAIAADVAWKFRDEGIRGGTRKHYQTMTVEQACALPVDQLGTPHGHLYLWVPNAFVLDGSGQRVAAAWGYEPKQLLTWVKPKMGTGRWFRNTTEQCLFCVRPGSGPKDHRMSASLRTHYYWPRGEHSEKPPEFYRHVVERMSRGPYLELFARYRRPGWTVLGDCVDGRDIRETSQELLAA